MVLLLDVTRFKYPPHWVTLETAWHDSSTSSSRGLFVLEKRQQPMIPTILQLMAGDCMCADGQYADSTTTQVKAVSVLHEALEIVKQSDHRLFKALLPIKGTCEDHSVYLYTNKFSTSIRIQLASAFLTMGDGSTLHHETVWH